MKIEYSQHIEYRLLLRGIDRALPERIYREAEHRYIDSATGHSIAVGRAVLYGKDREVMVAYREDAGHVKLLTTHPLKEGQRESRTGSGRWRKL